MKKIVVFITLLVLIFTIGKNLLPFQNKMFDFHDETQPARIQQFVLNLKSLKIPPRIAPNFSFNLGYPVFNHYAPFSYWITSIFNLIGFNIVDSLKLSFLLALIISCLFCFLFLKEFFDFNQSLLGAVLYATSPWMAVEIFIRGNLAELWFMALLPIIFWIIYKNSYSDKPLLFVLSSIIISFGLTVHNALSVLLIPTIFLYILLLPKIRKNIISFIFAFLISAYFLIPGVLELSLTYASTRVNPHDYPNQLLCAWQLWTTPYWGYGGSTPGCADGMSFMLGKPQILIGFTGLIGIIYYFVKNKFKKSINKKALIFMAILAITSIFMTTYYSFNISSILYPYIGWIQFPWRLLSFSLFGLSFLAAGLIIPKKLKKFGFLLILLAIFISFYNSKFFIKDMINRQRFEKNFLSKSYIEQAVAYKISEYLPKTASYQEWLEYEPKKDSSERIDLTLIDSKFIHELDDGKTTIIENDNFLKIAQTNSKKILLNIHYYPYWKIIINDQSYIPNQFDFLGRPIIKLTKDSIINLTYQQTKTEKLGNLITIMSLLIIAIISFNKLLWTKIK